MSFQSSFLSLTHTHVHTDAHALFLFRFLFLLSLPPSLSSPTFSPLAHRHLHFPATREAYGFPTNLAFQYKSDTDLYELAKVRMCYYIMAALPTTYSCAVVVYTRLTSQLTGT